MADASFPAVYKRSLQDPEGFWGEAAAAIDWTHPWDQVVDRTVDPAARWFVGARMNTCFNALDRHVADGRANQTALIYDSAVTENSRSYTFGELLDEVAKFAGVLQRRGVTRGDRVVIYMPMIPEAVIAMLACARLGAVHSVVFGGFASKELAVRIDDCTPTVVVSASCGLEVDKVIDYKPLLDEAIRIADHTPDHCIVYQREIAPAPLIPGRDLDWS